MIITMEQYLSLEVVREASLQEGRKVLVYFLILITLITNNVTCNSNNPNTLIISDTTLIILNFR